MSEEYLTPEKALENLRAIQSVIDGKIEFLDGMRKLASSELQQHEKRTAEVSTYYILYCALHDFDFVMVVFWTITCVIILRR